MELTAPSPQSALDDSVQFLEIVWGDREAWVDLPTKVGGHWVPYSFQWPNTQIARWRIESALADGEDIYFSVAQFKNKGRRWEDTLGGIWLWADLDEVHPEAIVEEIEPTVAWSSSPQRYQALWLLDSSCSPRLIEEMNRRLTYAIGADKSGWDLTTVLRVPGTCNWKYVGGPTVELLWANGPSYGVKSLAATLKDLAGAIWVGTPSKDSSSADFLADNRQLPPRGVRLLRVREDEVVVGERSDRLWELLCIMAETGWSEEKMIEEAWPSAWNKHQDSGDKNRLRREVRKARDTVQRKRGMSQPSAVVQIDGPVLELVPQPEVSVVTTPVRRVSPFADYASFLSMNLESPRWLIEEIWMAGSQGIIGGEPKSSKSTIALAMALSVASGKPFLNRYAVSTTGPVLVVQEENDPWDVQDKLRKLASYYGLIGPGEIEQTAAREGSVGSVATRLAFPKEVPLKLLNNYGFDMSLEEHRLLLEEEIRAVQPIMLILDSLYLMIGGASTDKLQDLMPFLKWLLLLKHRYGCAPVVVHHMRKARNDSSSGAAVRPGQRLLGSTALHGWVASALYHERLSNEGLEDNEVKVRIEREFRSAGLHKALDLRLRFGAPGDLEFGANMMRYDLSGQLFRTIEDNPGISVSVLAEMFEVDKRTMLARVRALDGVVVEGGKRGRGHSWKAKVDDGSREEGEAREAREGGEGAGGGG